LTEIIAGKPCFFMDNVYIPMKMPYNKHGIIINKGSITLERGGMER